MTHSPKNRNNSYHSQSKTSKVKYKFQRLKFGKTLNKLKKYAKKESKKNFNSERYRILI